MRTNVHTVVSIAALSALFMSSGFAAAQTAGGVQSDAAMPAPQMRPSDNGDMPMMPPPPRGERGERGNRDQRPMQQGEQKRPQPQREAMSEMRGKVQEMRGQLQKDRTDFKEKAQDMRDDMRAQGQQMRDDMKKQMEGATTPEARKALVDEMKAKRDAFQDQKQGMQDKIREGKQQFVKKNLDIASMRFGGVVQQFDSIVARMSDFVAKKKTEGKDVAALETSLATAKTAVDAAKADINKVADISKTFTTNTAGATDKAAIKTAVQAANDSIKKAHTALQVVAQQVKVMNTPPTQKAPATN